MGFSAEKVEELKTQSRGAVSTFLCACAAGPLLLGFIPMFSYWMLVSTASNFSSVCEDRGEADPEKCWNRCGYPYGTGETFTVDDTEFTQLDTAWSFIYIFNALVYTILTVSTVCIILSAFAWPLAFFGGCGICCSQLAHLGAIIVAGVNLYSKDSKLCAESRNKIGKDSDVSF